MTRLKNWPLAAFLAGLALLYLGERVLAGGTMLRIGIDAIGGLAMLAALGTRVSEWARARGDLRRSLGWIVALMVGAALAASAHWLAGMSMFDAVDDGEARARVVIEVLWLIAAVATTLPLVFVEVALLSVAPAPVIEIGRVRRSLESGVVLALAASLLFVVYYLASEHNVREDLTYAKTTEPSTATEVLVESLTEPLRIVLFFEAANEVKEEVLPYFETLAAVGDGVTLEVVDHDAEPGLAKDLKARKNGFVVLACGEKTESYDLGTDIDKAKNKLKKLDKEIHKRLIKVAKPPLKAYFTTGHGERSWSMPDDDDRAGLSDLRTLLRLFNYKTDELGLADGLASEVPDDASVVLIIGPTRELMDEEIASLQAYLDGGGSVFVLLDPEQDVTLSGLLAPMGITFVGDTLLHDENYVPRTRTKTDRRLLYTNRFSSHPAVKLLQKDNSRYPVVLAGAGYLEATPAPGGGAAPEAVLKSMAKTWADLDEDFEFDGGAEKRKVYDIGMAYAREVAPAPVEGEPAVEARALVIADADLISDLALRNDGNGNLVADGLKWLVGEEELAGEVASEEDVKIQHTRKKDTWWFYSTTFGIPLVVLGVGVLVTQRRKRRAH